MYTETENTNMITDLQKYYNFWQLTIKFPDLPKKPNVSIVAGEGRYSTPRRLCDSFKDYSDYEFGIFLDGELIHPTVTGYVPAEMLWEEILEAFRILKVDIPKESPINSYLY